MPVTRMATVLLDGEEFAAFQSARQACDVADSLWLLLHAIDRSSDGSFVVAWSGDGQMLSLCGMLTRAGAAAYGVAQMPMILRCDAPGCTVETIARTVILGRPQAPVGWWISSIAGRGQGECVLACSIACLAPASAAVRSVLLTDQGGA